jgi:hypothetical protein
VLKILAKPLVSELATPNEPDKDLMNEALSAKLEAEARESLRDL